MIFSTIDPTSIHVVLLKGGTSKEREISLSSATEVSKALLESGFKVTEIDMGKQGAVSKLESCGADVAFICLHGRGGEDGSVQGLCELLEIPYTGSGVLASVLAMDKNQAKHVYERHSIPTPPYLTLYRGEPYTIPGIIDKLGQRLVIKPAHEGSAIGIRITYTPNEIEESLAQAFELDSVVVVEKFVQGLEATVGVLGNDVLYALPVVEIVPHNEFYDFEAKYVPGKSDHIIPARISEENRERCQQLACQAHQVLGCRGFSRSDFIIDEDECWLLETNTIPGMTPTSLLPDAAREANISFTELCKVFVTLALETR